MVSLLLCVIVDCCLQFLEPHLFLCAVFMSKNASSELVCVQLLKSICMPVFMYAVDVLPLTKTDVARLDHALDRAVFRIFGCSSSADITFIREADISCITGYMACQYRNFHRRYFTCFPWSSMVLNCVSC